MNTVYIIFLNIKREHTIDNKNDTNNHFSITIIKQNLFYKKKNKLKFFKNLTR